MKRLVLRLVISLALVGPGLPATALQAQASAPPSLQQFVLTPGYQANIGRLFAQLPPDVFQRCPTLVSNGSSVTMIEPVTFAQDGSPTAGLWRQSFPVRGCGNDTTINFFFKAGPDGKVQSITTLPGSTHADLLLQRDGVKYAGLAVQAKTNGCSAIHIRTTRFDEALPATPASPPTRGRPWRETWTLSACGAAYDVPMTFIPDATGTVIHTEPAVLTKP